MRIINIVESTSNEIESIESFCVIEEQLVDAVVKQAEKLFLIKALENGAHEEDFNTEQLLDDGYFENGDYNVSIIWSNSVNE